MVSCQVFSGAFLGLICRDGRRNGREGGSLQPEAPSDSSSGPPARPPRHPPKLYPQTPPQLTPGELLAIGIPEGRQELHFRPVLGGAFCDVSGHCETRDRHFVRTPGQRRRRRKKRARRRRRRKRVLWRPLGYLGGGALATQFLECSPHCKKVHLRNGMCHIFINLIFNNK